MTMLVWASGAGGRHRGHAGRGLWRFVLGQTAQRSSGALILEGLLQKSLFMRDPKRWAIHALIFWPFMFRFGLGLLALIMSLWATDCPYTWVLLDKNHPFTAFVFDASGALVILGVILAVLRRRGRDAAGSISDLPAQDRIALGLLGGGGHRGLHPGGHAHRHDRLARGQRVRLYRLYHQPAFGRGQA